MPIALDSATSGMNAFQQMMDVIGNNIANVNTTGYKSSSTTFEDLLSQTMSGGSAGNGSNGIGGTNPVQVGLGTQVSSITSNFGEGSLQNTGNPNDLAINGTGFFVVSPSTTGGQLYYTRAGDFHVDSNGYLVNPNGYYLMGTTSKITTPLTTEPTPNVATAATSVSGSATSGGVNLNVQLNGPIPSTTPSSSDFTITQSINGANPTTVTPTSGPTVSGDGYSFTVTPPGQIAANQTVVYTVSYNPNSSTPAWSGVNVSTTPSATLNIPPSGSTAYTLTSNAPTVANYTIGPDGTVSVTGGNSSYISLVTVPNADGLVKAGDSLYQASSTTQSAGTPVYDSGDSSGMGGIQQGALEGSNVNLTSEMSNMIVAQTGYESNSKVINTENQMDQFMLQQV